MDLKTVIKTVNFLLNTGYVDAAKDVLKMVILNEFKEDKK